MRSLENLKAVFLLITVVCLFILGFYFSADFLQYWCVKQLPAALIIGAPKCGTAALSAFLSFHPDISIDKDREFRFFSDNYDLGFDWYKDQLPCSQPGQLVIERSSNYFRHDPAIDRIWRMNTTTKLILIVCEPVKRVISHFAMSHERNKILDTTFEQFIFPTWKKTPGNPRTHYIITNSNDSLFFTSWLRVFPFEQLHVVNGDNLKINPWQDVSAAEQFLGIKQYFQKKNFVYNHEKGFFCYNKEAKKGLYCLTPSKGRKHREVNENVKNRLHKFFKPYNELFYKQCKRKFSW